MHNTPPQYKKLEEKPVDTGVFSTSLHNQYYDDLPHSLKDTSPIVDFFQAIGSKVQTNAFVFALIIVPLSSASTGLTLADKIPPIEAINHFVLNDSVLVLDEKITFQFDEPFIETENITLNINPSTPHETSWNDDHTQLTVSPKTTWKPAEKYVLGISQNPTSSQGILYHFATEDYPRIIDTTPKENAPFQIVDEHYKITLNFDRDLSDYDINIVSRINTIAEKEILPSEKKVILHFTHEINGPQDIDIVVYAKHINDTSEHYYPVGNLSFKGIAPQPKEWPSEGEERVILAKERTTPKITEGKYIDINIAARITTLFEDGIAVAAFINSPGAKDTPTPTGHFTIHNKAERPLSQMFNVYLPYWMAFTEDGKYGIHDLIEWPDDHPEKPEGRSKESLRSIDNAVSPGCVRHTPENSQLIYEWSEVGTKVVIY